MFSEIEKQQDNFIFMDYAAGTMIHKKVFLEMEKYFTQDFFNPSALYKEAVHVGQVIEKSRQNIARIIQARPQEIVFCDGGTEANNLAIRGIVSAWKKNNKDLLPHIVTSAIEHTSVLETCYDLESREEIELTVISVDRYGMLDLKEFKKSLRDNTLLVSIGYVNGEIGVIQDIREIAKIIRHYRKHHGGGSTPYFHVDAVQAVNYLDINVQKMGVDMMTINGSKIYGPKKIACLYKKTQIDIDPIITGGSQEFNLRAGTENTPYVVGLSESLSLVSHDREKESVRMRQLQEYFYSKLQSDLKTNFILNGKESSKIPNIVNISIPNISSEEIVLRLDAANIKVSVRSACKSNEAGDSHVILALRDDNTQSIRFSMGRYTEKKDIDRVVMVLSKIVTDMQKTFDRYCI